MAIKFTINGKLYTVRPEDYPADITLNTFIREHAKLFGTKFYCLEGGCGVCIVTIRARHPVTNRRYSRGANSCLTLLNICDGWDVITIEGLGNHKTGYHPIQERLANFNGTQCGYCSPGMVMNMYSNLEAANGKMTMAEIENSFGGNLCRCTGYRPILDTMKSFASDSVYEFVNTCKDIEDLKLCPRSGEICMDHCIKPQPVHFKDNREWHHPQSLKELFDILNSIDSKPYMLVAGNTAHGVYRRDVAIKVFIDVNYVQELHTYTNRGTFELGANMTLTEVMKVLKKASNQPEFKYFKDVVHHLDLVAHVPVRNMGTIAGNLSIKHQHNEFLSDVFLLLTTIGARIFIAESISQIKEMSLPEFLKINMTGKVIVKIGFPTLNTNDVILGSYKIMPRTQNAHAYVNAGFLFSFSDAAITSARICYGGINPTFIESSVAVNFLKGRNLFSPETVSQALHLLNLELEPDWILPDPSPESRKILALGLFYKFILKHAPVDSIQLKFRSGESLLSRPLSSGTQTFDTRKNRWPINQPVQKLEAMWQGSGEALYANDRQYPHQLWAAFIPAHEVHATVTRIDPKEALSLPGVVAFYSAKDIPGRNSFVTPGVFGIIEEEEIFCSSVVKFHSQPVGVILAETFDLANYAATKVKIRYENREEKKIVATLKDALESRNGGLPRVERISSTDENSGGSYGANKELRGYLDLEGQFHFSMETQTTVCFPREDGLFIYASSHFHDLLQIGISKALKIRENQIDIEIRRIGGSFGCKISRSNHVAVTCALASWLSNRPVKFVQSFESNMDTTGKRNPCICDYSTVINGRGVIQSLALDLYEDLGCSRNEDYVQTLIIPSIPNCYKNENWHIQGTAVLTDAPSHSWFRAPGTLEAIAITENIMEHIARIANMDPTDVRLNNIPENSPMKKLLPEFIKSTDYKIRRADIESFNRQNRWRKRGISIAIMNFGTFYFENIPATVAIYHFDGSVAVTHGGIECGQGINTKVAQVAASTLGIPLQMVSIKATNSFNGANATFTGGSVTSEMVCYATQQACKVLLERIQPVREQLKNPTWVEIAQEAYKQNINLVANAIHKVGDMEGYDVWGLSCSEIEVDILTGNFQLNRVDILEDTGESLNPLIDLGQIEGAFIMGLSYWLTEKLVYDSQNGKLMTNRIWNYKVVGAKDIPIDFRVTLLQKTPNPKGFLRSKAVGEVAICMAISALFALRHALDSARKDANITEPWYHLGAPTTVEEILLAARHTIEDFKF